jgi:hypothetical protein
MFFDNKRISNFSLVELPVQTAGTYLNFNFPDQPQLRGRKVERITFYGEAQCGFSPNGNAAITNTVLSRAFLVLYVNDREDIKMPIGSLINITSNTAGTFVNNNGYIPLNDLQVIWEKSYVKAPQGATVVANSSWMFGVFYK